MCISLILMIFKTIYAESLKYTLPMCTISRTLYHHDTVLMKSHCEVTLVQMMEQMQRTFPNVTDACADKCKSKQEWKWQSRERIKQGINGIQS